MARIAAPLYLLYRIYLRVRWAILDFCLPAREMVIPRARLRFRVGETDDLGLFIEVGRRTASNLQAVLDFSQFRRILDFGCGSGRTLRWLCGQYPGLEWYGCDTDAEAIAWCCEFLKGPRFHVNAALPATEFKRHSFDLIYAVSVFTHFDELFQRAWMQEFHRILAPGGTLALTIHSPEVWTQPSETVRRKGLVFLRSGKYAGILPNWYHTTLQDPKHLEHMAAPQFELIRHLPHGCGDQDILVFRSRRRSSLPALEHTPGDHAEVGAEPRSQYRDRAVPEQIGLPYQA